VNDRRQLTDDEIDALMRLARTTDGDWMYRLALKHTTDRIEDEYADADLSDDDLEEQRLDSPVEWTS